ncbi:unnamed protein product [Heligmosomoides polygyrus]|uniref:Transcriptional regulator n=1 Tax=Heligmosomoides polygyrus TaxID=6339 RepID=A0A183FX37_HELPZ|nr:unnamed protein product [Heligmosomoides polygyrus]
MLARFRTFHNYQLSDSEDGAGCRRPSRCGWSDSLAKGEPLTTLVIAAVSEIVSSQIAPHRQFLGRAESQRLREAVASGAR